MPKEGFTKAIRKMRARQTRMEREREYWSPEETEQLETMFHEGIGLSEIAIRLQRTEQAICQQIEKMDLYNRKANPRRHKGGTKLPRCLCEICQVPRECCSVCQHNVVEEDCRCWNNTMMY